MVGKVMWKELPLVERVRMRLERELSEEDYKEILPLLEELSDEDLKKILYADYISVSRGNSEFCGECYVRVEPIHGVFSKGGTRSEVCYDGPDSWRDVFECVIAHPPSVVRIVKEPDRVYSGYDEVVFVLPPRENEDRR